MRLLNFPTLCMFLFTLAAADGPATVSFPRSPLPTEITANRSILWAPGDLDTYTAICEGHFFCLFRPLLFLPLLGYNDSGFFPFMSCGFLCTRQGELECDSALFAVILHYSSNGDDLVRWPRVLWSANRDRPVNDNATLEFSQDGNLILRDAADTPVWSTNTSGRSVVGMKLTGTGSLVLVDGKNATVWTSLDHPTDTWFLGQTLMEGQRLTANASATNSSRGQFSLGVVRGGLAAYIDSDPPQLYYQLAYSLHNAQNKSTYATFNKGYLHVFSSSFNYSDYAYIYLSNLTLMVQFMRLESDGHLRHYGWSTYGWHLLDDVFELGNDFIASHDRVVSTPLNYCSYPMVCGEYGVCSNHECNCLDHTNFNLINRSQVNLGCSSVTPLTCPSTKGHQLIRFDHISLFNYNNMDATNLQGTNEEQCKEACLRNCSCKAALFWYATDNRNGSCYLPSQIYSLMRTNPNGRGYNSTAHIKIQINQKEKPATTTIIIIVVVILGTVFFASLAIGFIILRRRRRRKREYALWMEKEEDFELIAGLIKRYSFEELRVATENFCQKLGQGGFGSVFEGTLNGEKVAVKSLDGVGQGMKEFLAEVNTIGNIHHINLVRLVGFCCEKSHKLLVYEYMSNGSLDKWIFCKNKDVVLDWQTRLQIITDVARGLSYLHGDCRQRIAHFDIKPQNILLDADFHAKVADFGLSKLIDRDLSHVLTRMRGTRGYMAPEWLSLKVTEKADVYSFGVVIMEIICGRKNLDYSEPDECTHLITMMQYKVQTNQLLDLTESNSHDIWLPESEVIEMMKLAMWCLQIDSARRPSMSMVVQVLEGSINVETDIDYNFTSVTIHNVDRGASTSQSASLLSGPR